ncbi:MAG: gamma carbonic anhydrase family protein, partial [Casimicrobiaceae bacterium]
GWTELVSRLAGGPGPLRMQDGRVPAIARAYVAPTSIVAGAVDVADDSSVFFGCAVSAGDGRIVIGPRSNVQDNSILATDSRRGDLVLGAGVTIGHNVEIGSATIGDDVLIGMGARLGDEVIVEAGACVAAGAWVEPRSVVPAGWIWAGRPARAFREIRDSERREFARAGEIYVRYTRAYRVNPGRDPPAARPAR